MVDSIFREFVEDRRKLEKRIANLEASEALSKVRYSTANTANPPTQAQLNTAFGTDLTAGFMGVVNDNGAGANEYLVWYDGSNWWYVAGAIAP